MNAGDTFVLVGVADRHLWIIISEPAHHPDRVVFVSLTSHDLTKESICLVTQGEHPFVKHLSCIDFSHTREAPLQALRQLQATGRLTPREPVSSSLLNRIRSSVSQSREVPFKFIELLIDQDVIE